MRITALSVFVAIALLASPPDALRACTVQQQVSASSMVLSALPTYTDPMEHFGCLWGVGASTTTPGTVRAIHWELGIHDKTTGKVDIVSSETATYQVWVYPIWFGLVIKFCDIESAALPEDVDLDVFVTGTPSWSDPGLVSLKLAAELSGEASDGFSIHSSTFPIVEVNAAATDSLTWPIGTGVVFTNVLSSPVIPLLTNFTRHPGPASMQWWCLYPDKSVECHPSFYMSTQDDAGVYKEYIPQLVTDGLRFSVRHVPEDNLNSTIYDCPFDTVLGIGLDDWYSAARRYGKWAEHQPWTAQGRMGQDGDFSATVRDMTMFGIFAPDVDFLSWLPWPDRHIEQTVIFGTQRIVPQTYGWYDHEFDIRYGDWTPDTEFVQVAAQNAGLGVRFSPYSLVHLISQGSEPNVPGYDPLAAAQFAVVKENGDLDTTVDAEGKTAYRICQSTQYAQDYAVELARQVEGLGAGGIYLDVFNTLSAQLCYATNHGHAPADPLNTQRRIEIAEAIHDGVISSDFYISSESVSELYLGEFELGMSQWTKNVLGELVDYYPLFETIYHPYTRVGRLGVVVNYDTQKLPPLLFQLLSRQTYAAHVFLGRTPFAGALINEDSLTDNIIASPFWALFIDMISSYMGQLTEEPFASHVTLGERLRDPDTEVAAIDLAFLGPFLRLLTVPFGTIQPAVYASAWGDPQSGTVLLMLENWTDPLDNLLAASVSTQSASSPMSALSLGFNPRWFEEYSDLPAAQIATSAVTPLAFQGGSQPYSLTFEPKKSGYSAKKWDVWRYTGSGDPIWIGQFKGKDPIELQGTIESRSMEGFLLVPAP